MAKQTKEEVLAQVEKFVTACKKNGFGWSVSRENVVRISKDFPAGDYDAFSACDSVYMDILSLVPLKGGSVWGTDGGSIGGAVALKTGRFYMNKSGNSAMQFILFLRNAK